jgi:hypothetical protein
VHVDGAIEGLQVLPFDLVHQHFAREHAARVFREHQQQVVLVTREITPDAIEQDGARGGIDIEPPKMERTLRRRLTRRTTSQDRAQPGKQLAGLERLR